MERLPQRQIFTWPIRKVAGTTGYASSASDFGLHVMENDAMVELRNMALQANKEEQDESLAIFDMGEVVRRFLTWKKYCPGIRPFYAVKAHDDPAVINLLAKLGAGFDCASKGEMEIVLELGVPPEDIIFANTIKFKSHLKFAEEKGVDLMTFDNEEELYKIKKFFPNARLVLRLATEQSQDIEFEKTNKYGCSKQMAIFLLKLTRELHLNVVGVSFHTGSGCRDVNAYITVIKIARETFDEAEKLGYNFTLLDIGGGFLGDKGAEEKLEKKGSAISNIIQKLFPATSGVRVISEPGRYFVESALTVATCVIGKRIPETDSTQLIEDTPEGMTDKQKLEYYMSDSLFGIHALSTLPTSKKNSLQPTPALLSRQPENSDTYTTRLWGASCAGCDIIIRRCQLPELYIGDWLVFYDKGAYNTTLGSNFNGIPLPLIKRVITRKDWDTLLQAI